MTDFYKEMVNLSRLALSGRRQDIQMFIRRMARRLRESHPDVASQLDTILVESPTRDSPVRSDMASAVPVDMDSRLNLVRSEDPATIDVDPIWSSTIAESFEQVIAEREKILELQEAGLAPTKSLLFVGPPGVGKSLAARWLASRLNRPLLTLDLSAVISSFLGRTGTNVRYVLDYAKSIECVLLFDEIDALAKKRDDTAEIGELKRLVTVLLQEIDDWPSEGILIAATNHPGLLDPAIWRRFELIVEFPMPTQEQVCQLASRFLEPREVSQSAIAVTAASLEGLSFSDIERELVRVHREAVVTSQPLEDRLFQLIQTRATLLPRDSRIQLASRLLEAGVKQNKIHKITGVHRDTIRKMKETESGSRNHEG